ncbi:Do family serine endopeptidase [Sphingomonas sabuli]|uniref:Probable periplasmic serine endoprotease DegP-like n=1 Tax=Sphingomonas sabuli TaxID=2764186 RepID=A0A7G9L647_9SPHN|nr:Do family serine endopeptidase [Sphingomonas sabuli]
MRYAYGVAMALLLGGTAFSIATGPVGAQTAQNAPMAIPPSGAPMSFANLADRVMPAVVNISTKQKVQVRRTVDPLEELFRQFGAPVPQQQQQQQEGRSRETGSLGSGFIISADGYIVTNNHLVQGANGTGTVDEVTVTLTNRKEYSARIIGRDPLADLALLKIDAVNLPFVRWGDSTNARVGDWILAIGNPYGLGGSVSSGIISALHRGITGVGAYDRYIQTDAAINMGNSGGPMFDLAGNVIGINSALISPTGTNVGIGLAIPAEAAKPVIDALRRGEKPERGYLGVGLQAVDEDIASSLGLPKNRGEILRTVQPNQAAAKAGLQQGDVIVSVNGTEVNPDQTVSYLVANTRVGSRIPLEVIRNGRRMTVQVVVGQRPSEEELAQQLGTGDEDAPQQQEAAPASESLGLGLAPITPQIARALNLEGGVAGVVVTSVSASGDAAAKGIQRGDVILAIQGQRVSTPAQVVAAVQAAKRAGRSSVLLLVKRGRSPEGFIGVDISGD